MNWFKQILTGQDNETIAIGRLLGILIAIIFIFVLPSGAALAMAFSNTGHEIWAMLLDKLPVYLTSVILSVAGLIGLTSHSEPRK